MASTALAAVVAFVSIPEGTDDSQTVGVAGLSEARAEGVAATVATSTNSGTQTQSGEGRSKKRRVLTEDEYLWVQGLREHAGVSPEQLMTLDLDEAAYEELLADFVDRSLRARPQIQQLQQSAMQAKRAQRDALRAAMTGEREVTKAEYEGLVEHHRRCDQACQVGVAALGQQAGLRVGLDLKETKSKRLKNTFELKRLQANTTRLANRFEVEQKASRDQLQRKRVVAAEALAMPVPAALLEVEAGAAFVDLEEFGPGGVGPR